MNDRNAASLGVGCTVDDGLVAVDEDPAIVRGIDPGEDLDDGALARAVLSREGMDPAASRVSSTSLSTSTGPKRFVIPRSSMAGGNGFTPVLAAWPAGIAAGTLRRRRRLHRSVLKSRPCPGPEGSQYLWSPTLSAVYSRGPPVTISPGATIV